MADPDSQLKANDLFDAVHGEALVDNELRDLDRLTADLDAWKGGHPSEWVVKPPYFYSEKIAVTYASSRLVSYFEIRREVRLMSIGVDVYGRVLDLDQSRVREIKGCGRYDVEYDFSNFRYGTGRCAPCRFTPRRSGRTRSAKASSSPGSRRQAFSAVRPEHGNTRLKEGGWLST